MIKINILCVGKIKEKFYTDAIREFEKRIGGYAKLSITEVKDEPTKEKPSEAERKEILDAEAKRLISRLPERGKRIALEIEGKSLSSEELAAYIKRTSTGGVSDFCFIIGGSLGLSDKVLDICDMRLSFSKMTFPHQLMRVILLEQIYRSFRIINNEPYHK